MAATNKSGAHLFIDTNVLLNFFAYSKDDLAQLNKLLKLIHAKTIKLYLTEHVVDEFMRNRDSKLAESFNKFRLPTIPGTPSFMLSLEDCKTYMKSLNSFEKAHSILNKVAKEAAKDRKLEADKMFSALLKESKFIEVSDDTYKAAKRRHRLGNPPGKADSLGDQLNWEMLLAAVPSGATLHIVTRDGDYASKLNAAAPNTFLLDEWQRSHGSELLIYEQIGHFFQTNFPNEDFSLDIEKREAIDRLLNSGTFAVTHAAIARLQPYLSFLTQEEAEEVVQGSLGNSQVSWVMNDTDVEQFFKALLDQYGDDLSSRLKERLEEALGISSEHEEEEEKD